MSVEIVMPQMGESITEGTITKWYKKVGDKIEKDEQLLEISTDKVDAEVPALDAGTLLEIRHQEGETVEVGTVLAVIGASGEVSSPNPKVQSPIEVETPKVVETPKIEQKTETVAPKVETPQVVETAVVAETSNNSSGSASSAGSVEVVMPQMGESITEGTVSKWHKKVGDTIERDEPLLEISTDKVDAEIPAPAGGTLLEIRTNEGETVEVGAIVALIGSASAVGSQQSAVSSQQVSVPVETPKVEPAKPQFEEQRGAGRGNRRTKLRL